MPLPASMHVEPAKIVLASASPRRAQLLQAAGYAFEIQAADIDEFLPGAFPPETLCCKNAERKARHIAQRHPAALVIGCDTIVCIDRDVLGKPADHAQAHQFLTRLQGRTHRVMSGVALIQSERVDIFAVTTDVTFKSLTAADIDAYLNCITFIDKAGAYAAQHHGDMIIETINGSYSNVVGLPMERLETALADFPQLSQD